MNLNVRSIYLKSRSLHLVNTTSEGYTSVVGRAGLEPATKGL